MTLTLTWIPENGLGASGHFEDNPSFYAFGAGQPSAFIERLPERTCIVLANGCIDSTRKTLTGFFGVTEDDIIRVPLAGVSIPFGCALTYRWGSKPPYVAPKVWDAWWLRHLPQDTGTITWISKHLSSISFEMDDTYHTNPDASGSARVYQSAWAGTLAAALGIDRERAYEAAVAFTDFQLRWRHALYYDASGKILRAHEQPWWRVGQSGWDGQVKVVCESPYKFETVQHLAPDIVFTLAVGWGDFAAKLYAEAYVEALLTRPEFRSASLCDDQRSHGYCLRLAALWTLAGMDTPERDAALVRVTSGLRKAKGFAGGWPYPARNPPKTGKWPYGWPSLVDWTPYAAKFNLVLPPELKPPLPGETCDHLRPWLTAQAKAKGAAANAFTDGPGGLWDALRAVSTFQTGGPLLAGLCALRDVPAAAALVPDIALLIRHVTAAILGPARMDGIDVYGQPCKANPLHYAWAALWPGRVQGWGGGGGLVKNGTITWLIHSLLEAKPSLGSAHQPQAEALAKQLWTATDYPSPPDIQCVGLIPYQAFGIEF